MYDYDSGQMPQGFSIGEFGNALGDSATGFFENVNANFDANAINNLAIANLNKAQADAIRSQAENRKQITKSIFVVLIVGILAIVAIQIAKKLIK